VGGSSCNIGNRTSHAGSPLQIVAEEPKAAQGLDCDSGDCAFLPNAPLRFKFDRWLIPTTAVRQSVSLSTEGTGLGVFLRPDYDVTARVLSVRPDSPLASNMVYILTLADADHDQYGNGFRAYDGASLEKRRSFAFRTGLPAVEAPDDTKSAAKCSEILAALAKAGCASSNCHGGNTPRMGLALDSFEGLEATAIDHVAHQTQTGTEISEQVVSGGRFGTQMPIIDSGRPENSYLVYKLLIGSELNREMDTLADHGDAFSPTGLTPSQIEDARAWFIDFGPMPPDEVGYPNGVSPFEFVTSLQGWIRAGAVCP